MTILTVDRKEFEKKAGKVTKELENKISMFGTSSDRRSRVVGGRFSVTWFVRASGGFGK